MEKINPHIANFLLLLDNDRILKMKPKMEATNPTGGSSHKNIERSEQK